MNQDIEKDKKENRLELESRSYRKVIYIYVKNNTR